MTILSDYCRDSDCPYCDKDICLRIVISGISDTFISTSYVTPTGKGYTTYTGVGARYNGTYDIPIPAHVSGCGYTCPTVGNRTLTFSGTVTKSDVTDSQNDCTGSLGSPVAAANEGTTTTVVGCLSTGGQPNFTLDAEIKTPLDDDYYVEFGLSDAWIHFPLCTLGCRYIDIPKAIYTGIVKSPYRSELFEVTLEYVEC